MERRFWLGSGILALFLVLGLLAAMGMEKIHAPAASYLEQAAQAALRGDMADGVGRAEQAETIWQKCRKLTASLSDHAPMEEIDSLFAQMRLYAQAGRADDFAAYCVRIARLVEAISEAHSISWQNLL